MAQFLNRAKREDGESDTELESVYGEEEGEEEEVGELFTVRPDDVPLMNSTMISSVSMTSDPMAASKLSALQDELSSLRQQIAMLVINQEQINRSQCRCHPLNSFMIMCIVDLFDGLCTECIWQHICFVFFLFLRGSEKFYNVSV